MKYFGFVDFAEFSIDSSVKKSKPEADHALVFMVRTLNGRMTQPIGAFATRGSAPGNVLAKMIISCILKLENIKLEVVAVISDGATNNESAWKYLGISGEAGAVSNKITNPADESRCIHFMCDVPHIFKCIRNNLHKQQFAKFRDGEVHWNIYRTLYNIDSSSGSDLRIVPKLTYHHVNPGPFQKMVVCYATQVFSKSMADGIKFYREVQHHPAFQNSETTETFTRCMNRVFDAGNARLPKEGLSPGSSEFKFLQDFLSSLQTSDNFAAEVTMASIRVTYQSILDIVHYLCTTIGYKYVLTAKLNQDCLEKFFGLLRSFGGDDAHPTITSFAHLFRLLSIYSPTAKTLRGNVRTDEEYTVSVISYVDTLKKLRDSQRSQETRTKADIEEVLLNKILYFSENQYCFEKGHNYVRPSPNDCIIYQLCGFLVFKSPNMTKCEDCISTLQTREPVLSSSVFTAIKDLGGLKHPNSTLVRLIRDIVEPKILAAIKCNITSSNIVNDVILSIDNFNCFGLGCSEEHAQGFTLKLVFYYITIRFYFHEKFRNKELLKSTSETKRKMKQAKLS